MNRAGEQGWPRVPRGEQGTLKEYQQGWEISKAGNQQAGILFVESWQEGSRQPEEAGAAQGLAGGAAPVVVVGVDVRDSFVGAM